jgi:hypothetical protein
MGMLIILGKGRHEGQGNVKLSTLVTNEFYAQPGRGEDVANPMVEIPGESLQFEGLRRGSPT